MMLYFFGLALLTAFLFRSIHDKLGSPAIGADGFATNDKGMILSALGAWICAKFNNYELRRPEPIKSGEVVTIQHRRALFRVFSEEYIESLNEADIRKIYNDTFRYEKHFLNPDKATFICPPCTLFWLAQIVFWPVAIWLGLGLGQTLFIWLFFEPMVLFFYNFIERVGR